MKVSCKKSFFFGELEPNYEKIGKFPALDFPEFPNFLILGDFGTPKSKKFDFSKFQSSQEYSSKMAPRRPQERWGAIFKLYSCETGPRDSKSAYGHHSSKALAGAYYPFELWNP